MTGAAFTTDIDCIVNNFCEASEGGTCYTYHKLLEDGTQHIESSCLQSQALHVCQQQTESESYQCCNSDNCNYQFHMASFPSLPPTTDDANSTSGSTPDEGSSQVTPDHSSSSPLPVDPSVTQPHPPPPPPPRSTPSTSSRVDNTNMPGKLCAVIITTTPLL